MNGEPIETKLLASNFAVDAFTTAAFSMTMTADEPIANFDKVPFVKSKSLSYPLLRMIPENEILKSSSLHSHKLLTHIYKTFQHRTVKHSIYQMFMAMLCK